MNELLKMQNICKSFGHTKALDNVCLDLRAGECMAIMGENGAGKSTLIKILMGVYAKDSGSIMIAGNNVVIHSPQDAQSYGVGAVYQDVFLAPELSIGENFFLGTLPKTKLGVVDWNTVYAETNIHLKNMGIELDSKKLLSELTIAQQQMVAIAKSIYQNSKILIFDEPTALLTNDEKKQIFDIIRDIKKLNHGVIYISHRMEEVFEICDRVTVLKDGKYMDTLDIATTNENELVKLMVGREFHDMYHIKSHVSDDVVLDVSDLSSFDKKIHNISFKLRKGEIFGMFGLIGSGRTEIVRMLFGADKIDHGNVMLNNQKVLFKHPKDAIKNHIGFISEDRKNQSLALGLSVHDNINLASYDKNSVCGFINFNKTKADSRIYIEKLKIKLADMNQPVFDLSGGNQQKVVIAKWLLTNANVLIADEPTIGVDVGARADIYKLFESLTEAGVSIILISSYLPEIMGLSDRILVMSEGKLMDIVDKDKFSEEDLMTLASGITLNNKG